MSPKGYDWRLKIFRSNHAMCVDWYYRHISQNNPWSHHYGVECWNNNPTCDERRLLIMKNNPWGVIDWNYD